MARSNSTRWIAALVALVVFIVLAWLLGRMMTLTDSERLTLRIVLVVLGVVTAAALAWFLRPQTPAAPKKEKDDELVAVDAARARMPRGAFDAKPLVLVVGTEGNCKTTVVTRAELDPELLAGESLGGDAPPAPTTAANLWLVKDAVLAEAGGPVFSDEGRWKGFVRALRPPRLRAALGRGAPPPRSAVVCVSCDLFYSGGAGEQLDALAALGRQRLADAARELGVALPVYVLFTKADRIPHFEEWSAPFTRDEVRPPLGAALPLAGDGADAAGAYAERLVPRVEAAFAEIVGSLAGRRLDLLGRETVPERRLGAYEVPREIGKLAPAATRFLVELCRPLQLGVSPKLRGFYFVGVRPVVVTDAGAAAPVAAAAPAAGAAGGRATVAFARPNIGGALGAVPGAYTPATTRRVPQWTFLDRFFPDVVFGDPVPAVLAGGGTRVAGLRRTLLGAGIGVGLVLSLGVLVSWLGNRSLARRTIAAARAVEALPVVSAPAGTIVLPAPEALRRLDDLRVVLDEIRGYETTHVPLHLRWGLWRGDALFDRGRQVWVTGYRRQLHDVAWAALVDSLRALPSTPRPAEEYGRDYGWLKAYLELTNENKRATSVDLAPVLLSSWQRGQQTDADITALARRQFEFFSGEVARDNPLPQAADAELVKELRAFLSGFQGEQRIYQFMLAEANKAAKPARLVDVAPNAAGVVSAPEVPGAFTAAGWKAMQDAFRNSDRFFQGERWVVGDVGAVPDQDRARLVADLRTKYHADYAQQWRNYLGAVSVTRPSSAADAVTRLNTLGGGQSPLLGALALAARNTGARVTDSALAAGFQPVHAITPPDTLDKFVTDGNKPYSDGLIALGTSVDAVAKAAPVTDTASADVKRQAATQALQKASDAKTAALQLAAKFNADPAAAQIAPPVRALLTAPIDATDALLRGVSTLRFTAAAPPKKPAAAPAGPPVGGGASNAADLAKKINDRAALLCQQLSPVLAKFPFNSEATTEATTKEVTEMFAPGAGALWVFQQERLGGLLEKQGDKWAPVPNDQQIALSQGFVDFFNRAARVSAGLFAGGADPKVVVRVHAISTPDAPQIWFRQGAQEARFVKNTAPAQFVWPSATGRDAAITATVVRARRPDTKKTVARAAGDWALFRLVAQATKSEGAHAEWNDKDVGTIAVDFEYESGIPVLGRNALGMACVAQVTK